jgi:hypothetical protein
MATLHDITEHQRPDPSTGAVRETTWHTCFTFTAPWTASPGYRRKEAFTESRCHLTKWHPASGPIMTDNPPDLKMGVYKVPCSCGKVYIGQTGCYISTNISKHIRGTKQENKWSVVAEHSVETKHSINFDSTEVVAYIWLYHQHTHNFN